MVDLQCCANPCYIAKWLSYTHILNFKKFMLIKISPLTRSSRVPALCWKPGSGVSVMNWRIRSPRSDFPLRAPCPLRDNPRGGADVASMFWGPQRHWGIWPSWRNEYRTHAGGRGWGKPLSAWSLPVLPSRTWEVSSWPFGGSQRDCCLSTNRKMQPPAAWSPWGHFSSLNGACGFPSFNKVLTNGVRCSGYYSRHHSKRFTCSNACKILTTPWG